MDPSVEAAPSQEVKGVALYQPFEEGYVQGYHMLLGNDLGGKGMRGYAPE